MENDPRTDVTLYVRGALFDMDGVLVDSTASDERCWLRWAQLHGMEGSFSIHSTHGRRAVDTVRALRPDLDPYVELKRLEDFDAEDPSGTSALPGAPALLAALPTCSWAIVTPLQGVWRRSGFSTQGLARLTFL